MTAPQDSKTLVINPSKTPHKQTIILLHGRGSHSFEFGPAILFKRLRVHHLRSSVYRSSHDTTTLKDKFPHAKFVFPTAPSQHSRAFQGSKLNQWFDNWPLAAAAANDSDDETRNKWRYELPIPGLRQTVDSIHGGVVLGGFSQGSAASLVSAILWQGDSLGAWVGISGWLPFAEEIEKAALDENNDTTPTDKENEQASTLQKGVNKLKNILDLSPSSAELLTRNDIPIENTPLFIAHGVQDSTVPISLGRKAGSCLEALGLDVQQKGYENGFHECSEEVLCDLVDFLWDKYRP